MPSEVPEQVSSLKDTVLTESLTFSQLQKRLVDLEVKVSGMAEILDSYLEENTYPEEMT